MQEITLKLNRQNIENYYSTTVSNKIMCKKQTNSAEQAFHRWKRMKCIQVLIRFFAKNIFLFFFFFFFLCFCVYVSVSVLDSSIAANDTSTVLQILTHPNTSTSNILLQNVRNYKGKKKKERKTIT